MSQQSLICILGYAVAVVAVLIVTRTPPGGVEHLAALLGAAPLGWYCAKLDSEGR